MTLFVNGKEVDVTIENEKTVGEVLRAFEEEAAKNDATTVSIMLDGNAVPAEDFEKAAATPLAPDTRLELTVVSGGDVRDAFALCAKNFGALATELKDVSVMLQSGKDKEANALIERLATEIDRFCHTATLSALFPDTYKKLTVGDADLAAFFEELAPVLKDFEDALAGKDTVTVGDLAEYEISPRIESLAKASQTAAH